MIVSFAGRGLAASVGGFRVQGSGFRVQGSALPDDVDLEF